MLVVLGMPVSYTEATKPTSQFPREGSTAVPFPPPLAHREPKLRPLLGPFLPFISKGLVGKGKTCGISGAILVSALRHGPFQHNADVLYSSARGVLLWASGAQGAALELKANPSALLRGQDISVL